MKQLIKKLFYVAGLIISTGMIFILVRQGLSYDTNMAHPMLADKSTALYNQSANNKLTDQEIGWIKQGAVDEDIPIRWMNHFYNPNIGFGLFGFYPANIWADSAVAQSIYLIGDQSWKTAIWAYNNGDKKRAFIALGHVLHLIEDMAVPAHTRIDMHPEGDPYEEWVKLNTGQKLNIASLVNFNNFNDYFYNLADYSNKYFLSKDTTNEGLINNDKYYKKNNIGEEVKCIKGVVDQINFCLVVIRRDSLGKEYLIFDEFVNSDYFSLLAPKAISYGAGIIDLFFKEAEAEKNRKFTLVERFKQKIIKFTGILITGFSNLFGDYEAADTYISDTSTNNTTSQPNQTGQVLSAIEEAEEGEINHLNPPLEGGQTPAGENQPALTEKGEANPLNPPLEGGQAPAVNPLNPPSEDGQLPVEQSQPITVQPAQGVPPLILAGDSTPPETTIISAPSEMINLSSATFTFISSESNSTYDCSLNDAGWEICLAPHELINLSDRSHIFKVRARDAANNFDQTPAEHVWTIDTVAPIITIVSGPPFISSSTAVNFQLVSSESNTTFECGLDANPLEICSASTTAAELIEGTHSLEIKGTDPVGNIGFSTFKIWFVDLTAPTSTVDYLEAVNEATGFIVGWNGQDADATGSTTIASGIDNFDAQYKIDAGVWQDWVNATTSTSTVFDLAAANGQTVNFRARARDLAGNTGEWSAEAQTIIDSHDAKNIVISEIRVSGISANDEFIELYNPTDASIDLSSYSIQYRGSNSLNFYKKNFSAGSFIGPKAYYLIVSGEYAGSVDADMAHSSFNLSGAGGTIFLTGNNDLLTDNSATATVAIDRLAYGQGDYLFPEDTAYASAPAAGQSLERKAVATSTAETMAAGGVHEKSGNNYDSNNNSNDFVLLITPEPQNSGLSDEPDDPPSQNIITAGDASMGTSSWLHSFSWRHAVSGNDAVLLVAVHTDGNYVNSVTYNGQAMLLAVKKVHDQAYNNVGVYLYYLDDPSAGENLVEVNVGYDNTSYTASAITFYNCDTTDPLNFADVSLENSSSTLNSMVIANPNMMIADAVTYNHPEWFPLTPGDGQTQYHINYQYGQANGLHSSGSYKLAGQTGAQTMAWNTLDSRTSVHAYLVLNPKP